jgi:BMFP domain-containing protein YqiC
MFMKVLVLLWLSAALFANGEGEAGAGGALRDSCGECRSELREVRSSLEAVRREERLAKRALLLLAKERDRLKQKVEALEAGKETASRPDAASGGASCPEVNPFPKLLPKEEPAR